MRLRQEGGLHSLHITHVGSEDEGLYEVSAANTHGQAHCSAQLYVEEPRTAATGPRYCLGPLGLLGCLSGALALLWGVWLWASGQWCGSCSSKLEKMPSIPEEPEQGELERLSMPDFLRPLQDLDVGLSKEAMLECQVTGLPYPTISWFHNGHRIQSSDDRRMTQCMCLGRDPGEGPLQHPLCGQCPPTPHPLF